MRKSVVLFLLCEVAYVLAAGIPSQCVQCRDYLGQYHQCNQWIRKATNACNTCYCNQGIFTHCRDDLCTTQCKDCQPKTCRSYDGQMYPHGQWVRRATTACNTCYCNQGTFTNCRDDLCSTTCKNYLGQIFQDGQYVEKATGPCTACYCSKGQFINCRDGLCPPSNCKFGQCQPVATCKDYLGRVVQHGQTVQQSSVTCHTCICKDGQLINCQPESCNRQLTCTDRYGKVYNSGDWVPNAPGDCNGCRCNNGRLVDCTNYTCQISKG